MTSTRTAFLSLASTTKYSFKNGVARHSMYHTPVLLRFVRYIMLRFLRFDTSEALMHLSYTTINISVSM